MKIFITSLCMMLMAMTMTAQTDSIAKLLKDDPRRAYGTDYPYPMETARMTKAPRGYKAFYISHYGRHGSRYYWTDRLYKDLDTLLKVAHRRGQLTTAGERFYTRYMAAKDELMTGVTELTDLGWQQHQRIARTMYNRFPEVFKRGGNVYAISSLVGRCVISMASFCLELKQCNPKIEVREQSSRFTLDAVAPSDRQNPARRTYPKMKPRYEQRRDELKGDPTLPLRVAQRAFTSTDSLPSNANRIGANLIDLYTTLPSIGHEGMLEGIVSDADIVERWEQANLGSYSWVFGPQLETIPILKDILTKAEAAINGTSDHIADLRFGHDSYLGPLTVLMGINGADQDPEDPYQVKYCYQNWETCKASNIQLIFYRGKGGRDDILVKCLLNGEEARLPLPSSLYPYYKWADFKRYYEKKTQQ